MSGGAAGRAVRRGEPRATRVADAVDWITRHRLRIDDMTIDQHNDRVNARLEHLLDQASIRVRTRFTGLVGLLRTGEYLPGTLTDDAPTSHILSRSAFEARTWNGYDDVTSPHHGVIYGYLMDGDAEEEPLDAPSTPTWGELNGYGKEAALVLRKEVREHTTFTYGDGLGVRPSNPVRLAPSWLDRPRWWSADFAEGRDPVDDLLSPLSNLPHPLVRATPLDHAKKWVLSPPHPTSYAEAQVHQRIHLRNIETIVLPREKSPELVDLLGSTEWGELIERLEKHDVTLVDQAVAS